MPEPDLSRSTSKGLIARAFSQQLIFRVLGMLANLFTVTATTRHLGPSGYGALTTAVVFVALWTSLTELGVGSVIVRKVMSGQASLERLVRVNSGLSLVLALPLLLIATGSGVAIYYEKSDIAGMIVIISLSLVLTSVSSCFQPVFVATVRFMAVSVSDLLSRLGALGLTILLVEVEAGLNWFAAVQVLPAVVILLIQGVAASRIMNCTPIFSARESWSLLKESLPQTAVLVIGVLYWRIDGVILSLMSTQTEVGVYGLAYTLAFTISVLPGFFATSTLSAMTRLYPADRRRFTNFILKSIETMLFLGVPIALVGAITAWQIVDAISSSDFVATGAPTLALLLAAATVGFVTGVLSQALFAAHDQVFLLRLNVITLLFNVAMNLVLAPLYGAVGAGISMLVTECVGLVVANWRLRKLTNYRTPWVFMLWLCLPAGASGAVAFAGLNLPVIVNISSAAAMYLMVNLVLGPMNWRRLRSLLLDRNVRDTESTVNPSGQSAAS